MTDATVSGERLVEMIAATKSSDSVEFKQTIRGVDVQTAGDSLGFDPIDAEIRQIVFFDTPDMALYHAGMSEYILKDYELSRSHLESFLEIYEMLWQSAKDF